jgi:membrane-associated phospholipid phosphatase
MMIKKTRSSVTFLSIALLLFLGSTFSRGQEFTLDRRQNHSLFATVKDDIVHVATSPFHLSGNDAIQLFSCAALNCLLIYGFDGSADEEFGVEVDNDYLKPAQELVKIGEVYDGIGSRNVLIGLSASMLTGGIVFKDKKLLQTTRLMIESAAIAGGLTLLGKGLMGRSRPYTNRGAHNFNPFTFSSNRDYGAFPSGHATSAFSMMTVIAKQYDQWWIEIPAYTLAISVALQRMESRNHWASDVLVGGAIGYWVGTTLVNHHKQKIQNHRYRPYFSGNRLGINITF